MNEIRVQQKRNIVLYDIFAEYLEQWIIHVMSVGCLKKHVYLREHLKTEWQSKIVPMLYSSVQNAKLAHYKEYLEKTESKRREKRY